MNEVFWLSYAALWLLVGVLALGVLLVIRELGELYLRSAGLKAIAGDGLDEGAKAVDAELIQLSDGAVIHLRDLLADGGVLIFGSQGCSVCETLIPRLHTLNLRDRVIVAYDEIPEYCRTLSQGNLTITKFTDDSMPLKYRVRVTPFAFSIDTAFRVRSKGLVNNLDQVMYHLGDRNISTSLVPISEIHSPEQEKGGF